VQVTLEDIALANALAHEILAAHSMSAADTALVRVAVEMVERACAGSRSIARSTL